MQTNDHDLAPTIIHWIAARTGCCASTLSASSEFAALGLDSIAMIELVVAVETALGMRLPEDTAQVCRTVSELVALGLALARTKLADPHPSALSKPIATPRRAFVLPRFAVK